MRTLAELIDREDPGIVLVKEWAQGEDANAATILPRDETVAGTTLERLQVTTRSILGAVVFETGGIAVANGLVRLLGSGFVRSLLAENRALGLFGEGAQDDWMLVADDAFGGIYALNAGRFGAQGQGEVFHLPADDTAWTPLEVGYSDFVAFALTGDLDMLYEPLFENEALANLPLPPFGEVLSFVPFLWTEEARERTPSSRPISATESARIRVELCGFEVA